MNNYEITKVDARTSIEGAYMVIKVKDAYFRVSKANTFDRGWETLIFLCDSNGEVTNWLELWGDYDGEKDLIQCANEFVNDMADELITKHIDLEGSLD